MITREQCLKWAKESGVHPYYPQWANGVNPKFIEALCQRVWNEAIEAAAQECDEWYEDRGLYGVDALAKDIRKMKDVK